MPNMTGLLAPLKQFEEIVKEDEEDNEQKVETKIPIPSANYLLKQSKNIAPASNRPQRKYAEQYEKFCEWSALPKHLRKPKTLREFEKKHILPREYARFFKEREDYQTKRMTYFWDWMMDLYPDVVYAVYQRATNKSSKDAGIFIDLLSKKMNLDKPRVSVQPMVLMGVSQEKIDKLFIPKDYEKLPTVK